MVSGGIKRLRRVAAHGTHPVPSTPGRVRRTALIVGDEITQGNRLCCTRGSATGLRPCSRRLKGPDLELGLEVIGCLGVVVGVAAYRNFIAAAWGKPGLFTDVVQVDQQRLVLPAMGHRDVAPGALQRGSTSFNMVRMQIPPVRIVEARGTGRVVALETKRGRRG